MRNDIMTVGELYERVNAGRIKSDIDVQREIVYDNEKQRLVIDSLATGVPLPAFYFWEPEDGTLEVLDGKQRINAITRFMHNDLEFRGEIWRDTDEALQEAIKSVKLSCIICSGEEQLKREIFKRINTLGVPLSEFEVLNGLFHGEYLRGLTAYVSSDKDASKVLGDGTRGKRQMKALRFLLNLNGMKPTTENINNWVENRKDVSFAENQREIDKYIDFVSAVFEDKTLLDTFLKISVKHVKSASLWKRHKKTINASIRAYKGSTDWKLRSKPEREADIEALALAAVGGIELDSRRLFSADEKRTLLEQQTPVDGKYQCKHCEQWFFDNELVMDHIISWAKGGRTVLSNAQLLCSPCNGDKGSGGF